MPRALVLFVILLSLVSVRPTPARASDPLPDRPWPVAAPPSVSSSFCEYREGHLHAGIDVRTYGREGIACIAAGDGYVSRVRATPTGYGKVVYVQLDSGETLVYAHLREFERAIDAAVVAEQRRLARYSVDLRLEPNRIRVRTGDVIAWSGSTGGVDPHLHFEVRNRGEHPLDPFSHGFALSDTLRPVIEKVALVPLGVSARIDGTCYPVEYECIRRGGRYVIGDTVSVDGAVAMRLQAYDRLNADSGRLAPRSLEVLVDGETVTRLEFQAFAFAHADEVGFVYDVGRVWTRREYWYQLYHRAGESIWNRHFLRGGALLPDSAVAGSIHHVSVIATDPAGNESELAMVVRAGPPRAPRPVAERRGFHDSEVRGAYFYDGFVCLRSNGAGEEPLRFGWPDEFGVVRAGPDAWTRSASDLSAVPVAMGRSMHLVGLSQGAARTVRVPAAGLELEFGERTLYTDAVMYISAVDPQASREPGDGPRPRSGAVRIGPYSLSLRSDMEIRFDVEGADSTDAIYRQSDRSGAWVFYPSVVRDGVVSTTARRPGVYAVMSDDTAPKIGAPRVVRRLMYSTGTTLPEIQVALDDAESGIDYSRCKVYRQGFEEIARWDGRAKKLFVLMRDENIMGTQALTVVAYDNVGHRSQLDVQVDIPRQK